MVPVKTWSPELEGLRGIASLWVMFGHICLLTQFHFPVLSDPGIGVDLFILLSGFLMAKNYMERQVVEPWNDKNTFFRFWIRRFFRIAPLYYSLLIFALLLGPWFGELRDIISSYYPTTSTAASRYADQSFNNLITHVTFVFGFIPQYSFNTVLPDWSIGLEMQYYALLPFIMILIIKLGYVRTCLSIIVFCIILKFSLPSYFKSFAMPSMIFTKLHMFMAGMLISEGIRRNDIKFIFYALIAPFASILIHVGIDRLRVMAEFAMIMFITALIWKNEKNGIFKTLMSIPKKMLTSKFANFLGDVSFSVYLLHLLIIIPAIAFSLQYINLNTWSSAVRFMIISLISIPLIYTLALVLFKLIEKPGVLFGKMLIKRSLWMEQKES
ncbi:acyltransferase family protein [Acerihabitans arboris]|uniref:Acyltransferase family protein n=1 Tax=Acerihabitans arboris TaxID=2691583 RepID=A0A845SI80_9GAMM|nr:acyltransferase [Acerihabitans arboris]NDL62321.1 acyltransferase family protein [Acerihabitans arboris]